MLIWEGLDTRGIRGFNAVLNGNRGVFVAIVAPRPRSLRWLHKANGAAGPMPDNRFPPINQGASFQRSRLDFFDQRTTSR